MVFKPKSAPNSTISLIFNFLPLTHKAKIID
jgi:hypothetical protein